VGAVYGGGGGLEGERVSSARCFTVVVRRGEWISRCGDVNERQVRQEV